MTGGALEKRCSQTLSSHNNIHFVSYISSCSSNTKRKKDHMRKKQAEAWQEEKREKMMVWDRMGSTDCDLALYYQRGHARARFPATNIVGSLPLDRSRRSCGTSYSWGGGTPAQRPEEPRTLWSGLGNNILPLLVVPSRQRVHPVFPRCWRIALNDRSAESDRERVTWDRMEARVGRPQKFGRRGAEGEWRELEVVG